MKDIDIISPQVREHLINVYITLAATLGMGGVGTALHLTFNIGSVWFIVPFLALGYWLTKISNDPENKPKRQVILLLCGFLSALSWGPFLSSILKLDDSILLWAFGMATLIFGCFSAAALLAERRSYLFLGGILFSALLLVFTLSICSLLFQSNMLYNLSLYGGFLVMSIMVVYDTQRIVERASNGNFDVESDALLLFVDFVNIMMRLMRIKKNNSKRTFYV